MAVSKIDEPALWKSAQNDNAKSKRDLAVCKKENRSLDDLIAQTGEAVIRSRQERETEHKTLACLAFSERAALQANLTRELL
jgi:hypothetical protein